MTGVQKKKGVAAPRIQEVHDFDARKAAKELLKFGFTGVDDIGMVLIESAEEELFEELGFAGDELDIKRDGIKTVAGPIFVFRDRSRITLKAARAWVFSNFPAVEN